MAKPIMSQIKINGKSVTTDNIYSMLRTTQFNLEHDYLSQSLCFLFLCKMDCRDMIELSEGKDLPSVSGEILS